MAATRILWVDEDALAHYDYYFDKLVKDYKVSLHCSPTNEDALREAAMGWDMVFYDIGMETRLDKGNFVPIGCHLDIVEKLRQAGEGAIFIGTTFAPTSFYSQYKRYFNEIIDSSRIFGFGGDEPLEPFCALTKRHGIVLEKRAKE